MSIELDKLQGNQQWNPLEPFNANMTKIENQVNSNENNLIGRADCIIDNNVFIITRQNTENRFFSFVAPDTFALGETFRVDGVNVTGRKVDGKNLVNGDFAIGSTVLCELNGVSLTIYTSGSVEIDTSDITDRIEQNETDIAKNTSDIAKNTSDIAKNTSDIAKKPDKIIFNNSSANTGMKWFDDDIFMKSYDISNFTLTANGPILDSSLTPNNCILLWANGALIHTNDTCVSLNNTSDIIRLRENGLQMGRVSGSSVSEKRACITVYYINK